MMFVGVQRGPSDIWSLVRFSVSLWPSIPFCIVGTLNGPFSWAWFFRIRLYSFFFFSQ